MSEGPKITAFAPGELPIPARQEPEQPTPEQKRDTEIAAAVVAAAHVHGPCEYEWREKPDAIVFELAESQRRQIVEFLHAEAEKGYLLVQMVKGAYWLFEKL